MVPNITDINRLHRHTVTKGLIYFVKRLKITTFAPQNQINGFQGKYFKGK